VPCVPGDKLIAVKRKAHTNRSPLWHCRLKNSKIPGRPPAKVHPIPGHTLHTHAFGRKEVTPRTPTVKRKNRGLLDKGSILVGVSKKRTFLRKRGPGGGHKKRGCSLPRYKA